MVINLTSSDNKRFVVDKEVILQSVLIRNMLEVLGESEQAIPLPNVTSEVLVKVLEYCEHHRGDPLVPADDSLDDYARKRVAVISKWDEEFIRVDEEMLFEIILAAHYLDIRPLLDVGCKAVADIIKGMSPPEIRKFFHITSDFSPEEEEQFAKETEWTKH